MQYAQRLGRFRSPTRTCGSVDVSRSGQVIGENSGVIVLQVAGTGEMEAFQYAIGRSCICCQSRNQRGCSRGHQTVCPACAFLFLEGGCQREDRRRSIIPCPWLARLPGGLFAAGVVSRSTRSFEYQLHSTSLGRKVMFL
jgi:hypothetical protein